MKNIKNMKNWSIITLFFLIMTSCSKDFLNRPPQDSVVDGGFYQTDDQMRAATALLYGRIWTDYNDKATYGLGDFRGGSAMSLYSDPYNMWFATTGTTGENVSAWEGFYNVITQSNTAIDNINRYAGSGVSDAVKQACIGEARFMRALAYRYLVMNWGAVPIITDDESLLINPTSIQTNTVQSIWKFCTNEMQQAVSELPDVASAPGRLTKWSAEGMLARFYLSRSGEESTGGQRNQQFLDSAKYYAQRVITMSGKSLLPSYRDLFLAAPTGTNYNNNNESLFELQWIYKPGGGTQNLNYGNANTYPSYINCSTYISCDGWGGDKSATFWMLSQYDGFTLCATGDTLSGSTLDQRLHETFMFPGFSYPEITQTINGADQKPFIYPNNGFDGKTFAGSQSTTGNPSSANIKKYCIGQPKDVGGNADIMDYPNDTYMLRLAEIYLIYAEAELGNQTSTSDPTALQYFNAVHTRAGLPAVTGPLTFDQIFKERAIEFAMESQLWYQLVDLHYWNPQKAYDIINNQFRGQFAIFPNVFPNPTSWQIVQTQSAANGDRVYATANDGNFLLPLPTSEVTVAPNLTQPPVDYYAK